MTEKEAFLKIRGAITRFDKEAACYAQSQGADPLPGSQAYTERANYKNAESLYTVAAIGSMLLESVCEHVSAFIKCHWALQNQPPKGAPKPADV